MKYHYSFVIALCGIFYPTTFSKDDDYIRCPLEWRISSTGQRIFEDSLPVVLRVTEHFIARITQDGTETTYISGRYETDGAEALVAVGNLVQIETSYEILTNPHKCVVKWTNKLDSIHAVSTGITGKYVGRGLVGVKLYAGEVSNMNQEISIVHPDRKSVVKSKYFQVLESYSLGLTLEMGNFVFENDLDGGDKEFMGIDQIINDGATTIVQSVSHRKKIIEKTVISNSKSWGHTISVNFNFEADFDMKIYETELDLPVLNDTLISVPVPNPSLSFSANIVSYEFSKSEVFTNEIETEINLVREIIVPPAQAIQVCSTLTVKDDFSLNYVAIGKFSAPGLSPEEVLSILQKDNKIGHIKGKYVYVEEKGVFGGTLALTSKFIIEPIQSASSCSKLSENIYWSKQQKKYNKFKNLGFELKGFTK